MKNVLLHRIDGAIEKAAGERSLGKKQFLHSCGIAPASYYRWRDAMRRGGRWEIPGWLLDLLKHRCGMDLSALFSGLASLPWSGWPHRSKVVVIVGAEDAPAHPLSVRRLVERDARAAMTLIDELHGSVSERFRVEVVVVSRAVRDDVAKVRSWLRGHLREAACVAAIGSPFVNPVVDILADDYVFGGSPPPYRFRWPVEIHNSFLSDPRANPNEIGILKAETGELFIPADPVDKIAAAAAHATEPVSCRDAAILAVDHRRARVEDPDRVRGERFELPIIILAMGVAAAGTEAAIRVLFEQAGKVDQLLRSSRPEGFFFEPVVVSSRKPAGTAADDIEIISADFYQAQPELQA
ncbi:MAG: hypothetical protein JXP34_09895 [Planctomycetes bacterium]|nr:hypothetical protein [Planctomycetota bacterium]